MKVVCRSFLVETPDSSFRLTYRFKNTGMGVLAEEKRSGWRKYICWGYSPFSSVQEAADSITLNDFSQAIADGRIKKIQEWPLEDKPPSGPVLYCQGYSKQWPRIQDYMRILHGRVTA